MNPIDAAFRDLRTRQRKAFIPFLTAGDPDVPATVELGRVLAAAGDLGEEPVALGVRRWGRAEGIGARWGRGF
jgi:tryptophan synthase alpha chain